MPEIVSRAVRLSGEYFIIAGLTMLVFELDSTAAIQWCQGTTVPVNGTAGYALGCCFTKTTGTTAGATWINEGSNTSCAFHLSPNTVALQTTEKTIATTSNTDAYLIAPVGGSLLAAFFSGVDALAASDTNYITFSITNLGQAGAGSAAMLAATAANTTQATGGTALSANTKRALALNATAANLVVAAGDRLRIRYAATGTLANTVTFAVATLNIG